MSFETVKLRAYENIAYAAKCGKDRWTGTHTSKELASAVAVDLESRGYKAEVLPFCDDWDVKVSWAI